MLLNFEDVSNKTLKFKAFKIVDTILLKFFSFLSNVNLEKTINCFEIGDNFVSLTYNGNQKLYALKLETFSNRTVKISDFQTLTSSIKLEDNSETLLSIVKQNGFESIYLFTLNHRIADEFSNKLGVDFLKGYEILNAVLHTFLLDVYEIQNNKLVERYLEVKKTEDIDLLYKKFPSLISIASFNMLQKYTPYQITSFKDDPEFSIIDLLKYEWEGVCHLFFNFNIKAVETRLKILQNNAKIGDSVYTKAYKELSENPANKDEFTKLTDFCFLANGMFFLRSISTATTFQSLLKVTAEERYLGVDKMLPRTLLLKRDLDFDIIIDSDNVLKYFKTSLCKDCLKGVSDDGTKILYPDFYGTDINGNFFNYMIKNNESPHGLIFGTTGAGKSVATLKIACQIMGFDYNTGEAHLLSKDRKIRYLNVGYTGGRIFERIYKKCRADKIEQKVEIVSSDVNKLRFSIFDFDNAEQPTKVELDFLTSFFNLMLEVSADGGGGVELITALETPKLHIAISELLQKKEYGLLSLYEIESLGGYELILNEIYAIKDENGNQKYSGGTFISDISESIANNFKKPTIKDLYNYIIGASTNTNYTEQDRELYKTLAVKIQAIDSFQIFSYYSNLTDENCFPLYYVDFDKIKANKRDFVAIGWLLIQDWFKKDKAYAMSKINSGEKRPDAFYFVEEAHNFLGIKVFEKLFEVFAREVRKYGIHLLLITQSAEDVSVNFAKLFNTRMFIFSEEYRNAVYENIKTFNGGKELDEDAYEVFKKIDNGKKNPNKMICMLHDKGINAFRIPNPAKKEHFGVYFAPYDIPVEELNND